MLLYQKREKVFPATVDIAGKLCPINADYRNILRIFALLRDDNVNEYRRVEKLVQWLFTDEIEARLSILYEALIQAFVDFVKGPDENKTGLYSNTYGEENAENEKQFDYDYDAEEIYASFLSEYGIDLVEVDFLHWYKFKILLGNLSNESAFKKKIELRFMDLSHFKGQALADMTRAKESVQLPVDFTEEELKEREEFESVWGHI